MVFIPQVQNFMIVIIFFEQVSGLSKLLLVFSNYILNFVVLVVPI